MDNLVERRDECNQKIMTLSKVVKDLNKKIKSFDCHKNYISKKKKLFSSDCYLEMKEALKEVETLEEHKTKKEINNEIKELKKEVLDIEEELSQS